MLPVGIGTHCLATTPHVRTVVLHELMISVFLLPTGLSQPTFLDLQRMHELAGHRVDLLLHWSPLQQLCCLALTACTLVLWIVHDLVWHRVCFPLLDVILVLSLIAYGFRDVLMRHRRVLFKAYLCVQLHSPFCLTVRTYRPAVTTSLIQFSLQSSHSSFIIDLLMLPAERFIEDPSSPRRVPPLFNVLLQGQRRRCIAWR